MIHNSYITVTEMPGNKASKENLDMLYTRYKWASQLVEGKDVLEAACGAGQGLGYLAHKAKRVVAGDIDEEIVKKANDYYKGSFDILKIDACDLPFEDNSFDAIILFEAIYYLREPEKFVSQCQRILRDNGLVLISSVNKDWPDFNPSPFSFKYFSASELADLFKSHNFQTEIFGGFESCSNSFKDKIISFFKKTAVKFHLIPKTMKGKEKLKRIFFGKLLEIPFEIKEGVGDYHKPIAIVNNSENYKMLYLIAKKND